MTEQKLTPEEEQDLFKFDSESINDYDEAVLVDAGEYVLEVDKFVPAYQKCGIKVVDGEETEVPLTKWATDTMRYSRVAREI